MELEVKKSRGGQKKTSLAIARAKLWCLEVKERTALPYKTLDEMFLGKDPGEVFLSPLKHLKKYGDVEYILGTLDIEEALRIWLRL